MPPHRNNVAAYAQTASLLRRRFYGAGKSPRLGHQAVRIARMYAIMTVTGADSTGIIAAVTTTLAELDINVIDVSQTLMGGYFTMILRVEFDADKVTIQTIKERMRPVAEEKHQSIRIQSEDLFTAMNEI